MIVDIPEATSPEKSRSKARIHSLDGVRGVAAFVVVASHVNVLKPELALAYTAPELIERWSVWWWMSFSPLRVFWPGIEAIYLFFVLSGYVLALPFVRGGTRPGWLGYFPKRLIRLYLPAWGAFALAFLWLQAVPRHAVDGFSWWLAFHRPELTAQQIRTDLMLFPNPGFSNTALWTLQLEVVFSLLLPVYVLAGRKLPGLNLVKALLLMGATVYAVRAQSLFGIFLPVFGLGVLMAIERPRLSKLGAAIHRLRFGRYTWALLGVLSLLTLSASWTLFGLLPAGARPALALLTPVTMMAGSCLLIFVVVHGGRQASLSSRPALWLGSRCYSLYLVHEPIIVSTALLLGPRLGLPVIYAVAAPTSLAVAEIFHRLIERPSHRLARSVERKLRNPEPKPPEMEPAVPERPEPVIAHP